MELLVFTYLFLAGIIAPVFVIDIYKFYCTEHYGLYEEELSYSEIIVLVSFGVVFGGLVLPCILIRGIIQVCKRIKERISKCK